MRITESKLRRLIRSVIAEVRARNVYLDEWMRDVARDMCADILDLTCHYVPSSNDEARIVDAKGRSVLTLAGNTIQLDVNEPDKRLSEKEINALIDYLDENCPVLKNPRLCDGVTYTPTVGNTINGIMKIKNYLMSRSR